MKVPILYSFRRCPYAMRARMALHVSNVRCELREVVLRDKPEEFLKLSHKGTVPVLALTTGEVLEQSIDIMLWALENSDPQHWLLNDPASRADSERLIEHCDGEFKYHLDRYKYTNRYDGADMIEHQQRAAEYVHLLNERLLRSPFLHGEKLRLSDVALAPFIRQFANTNRTWFAEQNWHNLSAWLDRIILSDRFSAIMLKYAQWVPGADPTYFPDTLDVS